MLQLATLIFLAKASLKTPSSSLREMLIYVSYNNTRPIERHKMVISDLNPQVDPNPDLQVISLKKRFCPNSYQWEVTLYLVVSIKKFGSNLMLTSKLRDELKYEESLRVTYSFNHPEIHFSIDQRRIRSS